MISFRLPAALRCLLLSLALGALAWPALAGEPPAFGLIVGYRDGANPLSREETDRGPWADRGARLAGAWQRAAQRSRERTEQLARETGVRAASVGEAGRAALLRFERPLRGAALADAMRRVRLHPDVAWVEPNVFVPRQAVPGDLVGYSLQWYLHEALSQPAAINMPPAWDLPIPPSSPVVAVVDSGVRFDHPDLVGRLLSGHDFVSLHEIENDGPGQVGRDADPSDPGDWVTQAEANDASSVYYGCTWDGASPRPYPAQNSSWHGTFIAGQIAAAPSNDPNSGTGIDWLARVLPVRVSGKCGALVSDLLDGVRWAAGLPVSGAPANPMPARVINLSFGGSAACTPAYQDMADDIRAAGALLVVAAGNKSGALTRPADCQGVMAVAAVQRDGAKAPYSNFGAQVALAAPGGWGASVDQIYSTSNGGLQAPGPNTYGYKMGTSFAAPLAAGVASLMLAINPSLTPQALMERMQQSARPWSSVAVAGPACTGSFASWACRCTDTTCGAGLLDAHEALQLATGPAAVIQPVGVMLPGAFLTLDGRASVAPAPANVTSYQWAQESGPAAVAIPDNTQSLTGVQLPAVEGRWVFRLTITDSTAATGSDTLVVRTVAPPSAPVSGGGGGSLGIWWGLGLALWGLGAARASRRRR